MVCLALFAKKYIEIGILSLWMSVLDFEMPYWNKINKQTKGYLLKKKINGWKLEKIILAPHIFLQNTHSNY